MTKNLLLSAAAVSALIFAGAANAGTITTTAPHVIAKEKDLPAGGFTGTIGSGTTLTHAVNIPAETSATYTVHYVLAGDAIFTSAPAIQTVGSGLANNQGGTVYLLSDKEAMAIIPVNNTALVAAELTGFAINGGIKVTAKNEVTLRSTVKVVNGGTQVEIDAAPAKAIVDFKPLIAGFSATSNSVEARLSDYTEFGTGYDSYAEIGDALKILSDDDYTFHSSLATADVIEADDIITAATVLVTGTSGAQLNKFIVDLGTTTALAVPAATDTSVSFTLNVGDLADLLDGTGIDLNLVQPSVEISANAAKYSVSVSPTYATGYTGVTSLTGSKAFGEITLEGTTFVAPWLPLNNNNATGTLRLANNGTEETGPVYVSVTAVNSGGLPVENKYVVTESLAAGGVVEVTGKTIATALGVTAQNGDLKVTVEADGAQISGKVRVHNIAAGTFTEQSLGNLND